MRITSNVGGTGCACNDGAMALEPATPRIAINYCTQCNWLLRAHWFAAELLSTFVAEVGEVALIPGTNAVFTIHVNDELIWDRATDGGFPEITELKRRVRDEIAPDKSLGHSDRQANAAS
ncbi:SelT/SelW/SelH family protein [soil metagenome]